MGHGMGCRLGRWLHGKVGGRWGQGVAGHGQVGGIAGLQPPRQAGGTGIGYMRD